LTTVYVNVIIFKKEVNVMEIITRLTPQMPVTAISGVGKTRAIQLSKLGIFSVNDLLYHFPRAYQNRGLIKELGSHDTENECSYLLTVANNVSSVQIKRGMTISKFRAFDESGSCEVVFFNSPFIKDVFKIGTTFRFYGKCSFNKARRLTLTNPKYEPFYEGKPLADFVPVYPLTEGLTSKNLDKLIAVAINDVLPYMPDPIPEDIRLKEKLPSLAYAIKNMHFPENEEALKSSVRRLAFDEILSFGLAVSLSASERQRGEGVKFNPCSLKPFLDMLPYELTGAQKRAVNDIYKDTVLNVKDGKIPTMARIVVGDVGSGKTVCAEIAIYISVCSGFQCALMVPTEILAEQHYKEIFSLFSRLGISVALLTGRTKQSEKKKIYEELKDGKLNVVIGTHALLSDKVEFSNLGLIITDEQHRFGVKQRAILKDKAKTAHMLVMSATPIPRTLALALYGDLDISRIDEMPKGRTPVETFVVDESYRVRLNEFIKKQVSLGGQCYIVCPSIEKEENEDEIENILCAESYDGTRLKNIVEYTEQLKKALPSISISQLHGKMKGEEKEELMRRFSNNEISVLVSTTVIEVGVNVPNASVMVVENAERFGLSQLHQLRGRVGRGTRKSYCILVSDAKYEKAKSRLNVIKSTTDGYEIADKDLLLRGPGDFFSQNSDLNLRQSGGFEFKMATECQDSDLVYSAFSYAKAIVEKDPDLVLEEHAGLCDIVSKITSVTSTIS
jgi:ATP-dependent DNA helicase RecG